LALVVLRNADDDVGAVSVVDLGALAVMILETGRAVVELAISSCVFCDAVPCDAFDFLADASFSATILCDTNLASGVDGPFVVLRRCIGDLDFEAT
jgi:hypothetical protein